MTEFRRQVLSPSTCHCIRSERRHLVEGSRAHNPKEYSWRAVLPESDNSEPPGLSRFENVRSCRQRVSPCSCPLHTLSNHRCLGVQAWDSANRQSLAQYWTYRFLESQNRSCEPCSPGKTEGMSQAELAHRPVRTRRLPVFPEPEGVLRQAVPSQSPGRFCWRSPFQKDGS